MPGSGADESRSNPRNWKVSFGAILALGVVLRYQNLSEPQLWLDELIQLVVFSKTSLLENLRVMVGQPAVVPLDYLVQNLFVRLLGPGEFGARFHAALFGCLSLPLLYGLVLRLLGRRQALIAMLFFAVYPLHVFYSREGRNYSLFAFLTVLSVFLLLRVLEQPTWGGWLGFGLSNLLLLYTNYLAGLILLSEVLVVLSVYFFPTCRQGLSWQMRRVDLLAFSAALGIACALFLPWVILTYQQAHGNVSESFLQARFLLRIWREMSGGSSPLSLTLMLLAGCGVWKLYSQKKYGILLLLASWFVMPFGVLILDWWRSYFFAIRQVLSASPALIILAAAGLGGRQTFRGWPGWILLLVVSVGIGTVALSDRKNEADWDGLVRYLEDRGGSDPMVAPGIEAVLAYLYPPYAQRGISVEALRAGSSHPSETPAPSTQRTTELILIIDYLAYTNAQESLREELYGSVTVEETFSLYGFDVKTVRRKEPPAGPRRGHLSLLSHRSPPGASSMAARDSGAQ